MLMVGDPGTGKSQILRYVSKLVPRSIMTTGIGSTNAGLTVAAIKVGSLNKSQEKQAKALLLLREKHCKQMIL